MSLQGARIWLVTRGSGRAGYYQAYLLDALTQAGASTVDLFDFGALFRSAAVDLSSRATDWVEGAASRLLKGLDIRRLFGRQEVVKPEEGEKAVELPEGTTPDLIVVDDPTLFRALRMLPAYRQQTALTVALIDDFQADPRWRKSSAHAFLVPHEIFKTTNVPAGTEVPIRIAGPPVVPSYSSEVSLPQARAQLGLELGSGVLVVAAEGCQPAVLEKLVFQLTLLDVPPAVLFDYGTNDQNAQLLRTVARNYGLVARMFSDPTERGPCYAAADLVMAGADDPAVLDILLCDRPVILVGAERGAARAPFLADQGAVIWCEELLELAPRLESLLPPRQPPALLEKARALVRRQGTDEVVAALTDLYCQRETLLAQPQPSQPPVPQVPVEPSGTPLVPQAARFETIGETPTAAEGGAGMPPITAVEAKDQMAALILKEREAERSLTQAVRDRDRWSSRLDMAREVKDEQLLSAAEERLAHAREQVVRFTAQLETIQRSKEKLKQRVSPRAVAPVSRTSPPGPVEPRESGAITSMEDRFRKMEVERDLARLRQRLREEGS